MTGTFLDAGAIILGGLLGALLGARLPEKLRETVFLGLGIFSLAFGLQMFLKTDNPIVPLVSLLIGAIIGEWLNIEDRISRFGDGLETWLQGITIFKTPADGRFMKGFITASILYCVGPMSILGPVQNGLTGDINLLTIKSVLDLFGSLAFSSTLGLGVVFSSIPTFLYQGAISLFAIQVQNIMTPEMINEFTSVGGIVLASIAISGFLEIKIIRTSNFLPALFLAPLFSWAIHLF